MASETDGHKQIEADLAQLSGQGIKLQTGRKNVIVLAGVLIAARLYDTSGVLAISGAPYRLVDDVGGCHEGTTGAAGDLRHENVEPCQHWVYLQDPASGREVKVGLPWIEAGSPVHEQRVAGYGVAPSQEV